MFKKKKKNFGIIRVGFKYLQRYEVKDEAVFILIDVGNNSVENV